MWFFLGLFFGLIIRWEKNKQITPENNDTIEKLNEQIAYYKDLCKWHVEDKERIKNENLHKQI
jgi:hypothetical protein